MVLMVHYVTRDNSSDKSYVIDYQNRYYRETASDKSS